MAPASLLAFTGLSVVLALTPGPDTFLVLRHSLSSARAGYLAALGCILGTVLWSALVGVGVAALLQQSAEVYHWLKVAGGLYLLYLGVGTFLKARRAAAASQGTASGPGDASGNPEVKAAASGLGSAFAAGTISCSLNPKVGLFFLALMPQFIPAGANTLLASLGLGAVVGGVALAYFVVLVTLASKAMAWLKRPAVNGWLERISSGILAALGLGVVAGAFAESR
ncbi:threonine transporter RhtB [Zafaria cholistanensis]|uniref:Threonine transporter RhtB n=1 Tax=Zafaria cholistanensis TaxID=1682741 RepID=A0A5A7NR80_9MICC|nr:LysE family translocator [Zafaria cholistanensis]GER22632.1 threonine transporter RhtB [Zafaria cholistanensis]